MTSLARFTWSAWLPGALVLFSAPARAEERSFALDYWAPEGCTAASAFVERVRARTHPDRWEHAAALSVSIRVVASDRRFVARLAIEEPGLAPTVRSVDGSTCPEVVEALSLILALAIDPEQRLPAPEPPSKAPAPEAPRAPVPAVAWAAGAGGALSTGLAPGVSPGARIFLDAALSGGSGRLALSYAPEHVAAVEGGTIGVSLFAGTLDACPFDARPWEGVALTPCVTVTAGVRHVRGTPEGIFGPVSGERWPVWAAAGAKGRVAAHLALGLWVELEAEAVIPISRNSFVFDFDGQLRPVFDVPVAALGAAASLAYHFP
jgi:hypothetical protein